MSKFPHLIATDIAWDYDPQDVVDAFLSLSSKSQTELLPSHISPADFLSFTDDAKERLIEDLAYENPRLGFDLLNLPDSVVIPSSFGDDEEAISDFLSDSYGFCHAGFNLREGTVLTDGVSNFFAVNSNPKEFEVVFPLDKDLNICGEAVRDASSLSKILSTGKSCPVDDPVLLSR